MKMFKMLRMVCFLAMAALLVTTPVQADILTLGTSYSTPIPMNVGTVGGGSIDISKLNNVDLKYLYCVDLFTTVSVGGTYADTTVNNLGKIHGVDVANAGRVAWLLTNYGVSGQGDNAKALQAAIWTAITPANVLLNVPASASFYQTYLNYLAASDGQEGIIGNFKWITPMTGQAEFQGQVTTPIPAAVWLLGSGLVGLIGIRRRFTS